MNPFKTLELDNTASPSDVKKQYKKLLFKHHPDHGGSIDGFLEFKEAYKKALEKVENTKCPDCFDGVDLEIRGWCTLPVTCRTCKGSGKKYNKKGEINARN